MNDSIKLYYDSNSQEFSITPSENCVIVYESHHKLGWFDEKEEITQGHFRIVIRTNFYPNAPEREYLSACIYVNELLLLPISLAWRKTNTYHTDIVKDIFIEEWGNNLGVISCYPQTPCTIVHLRKRMKNLELDWSDFLLSICNICNDYQKWITNEAIQLIKKMKDSKNIHWGRLSSVVSLLREYDDLVPNIKESYRPFLDNRVVGGLNRICDDLLILQNDKKTIQKEFSKQKANVLWKYANDYLM